MGCWTPQQSESARTRLHASCRDSRVDGRWPAGEAVTIWAQTKEAIVLTPTHTTAPLQEAVF